MLTDDVLKNFSGKNVLVTGGTGMIGRQIVDILLSAGALVRIVSLDDFVVDERAMHIPGDLTSLDVCTEATLDMDYVFHIAGVQGTVQTSSSKIASHFVPTLMMNTNMLEACRINRVGRVVYTSSIGAYADAEILRESDYRLDSHPMVFAGWAKRMTEQQIYAYKVQYGMENIAIVRPANVYGPGDNFDPATGMVISALLGRISRKENPIVVWGDGRAVRDFVYSRDVAEGVVLAMHYGTSGDFVNLGSGVGHSIRDVVEALRSFIEFDYLFDTSKPSGVPKRVMDISRAGEWLGYAPATSLAEGLRRTWEWLCLHPDEYTRKKNFYRV